MDTAQGRPGDALEYTTAAGGAAYIVGPRDQSVAYLEASHSYVTDTPDFFRRAHQHYPEHGGRFTGEPAYFKHTAGAVRALLDELGYSPEDFAAAVFHQPNAKFPQRLARMLGFSQEQIGTGLLSPRVGNVYAGSSMLGLTAVLDEARPGDRVLLASFGSGAGSDAFSFVVTDLLAERRGLAPSTQAYLARRKPIDYALYVRYRRKLTMR
jgi:hydroxymethylglutaryl-CoA synthase